MAIDDLTKRARGVRQKYAGDLERIQADASLSDDDRRRRIAALWSRARTELEGLRRAYVEERDEEILEDEATAFAPPQGVSVAAVREAMGFLEGGKAAELRAFHRDAAHAQDRAALVALGRAAHRRGERDLAAEALRAVSPGHAAAYGRLLKRTREGVGARLAASAPFSVPDRPPEVRALGDGGADLAAQEEAKR